jgi:hypothetical protein
VGIIPAQPVLPRSGRVFNMQPVIVFDHDNRIALGDMITGACFCRKHDASRGIDFEVIGLSLGGHGMASLLLMVAGLSGKYARWDQFGQP